MDYDKWQRRPMKGHRCAACKTSEGPCGQRHHGVIKTNAKGLPSIGFLRIGNDSVKRTRAKSPGSTTDRRLDENHHKARTTLSSRPPLSYRDPSVTTLHARCQRLEEDNAAIQKMIIEVEDGSMKKATQHLLQYERAGSNVLAVKLWADRQIQDAQQDLEKNREERQERLTALRMEIEACERKLQEAQKDLQQLREYRYQGNSMAALQAAELKRQLLKLSEHHQDEAADVEDLTQTELQKLLDNQQKVKEHALQAVVERHMECLPLSLKRICLHNQEMKQDIQSYQQMVAELQEEVLHLQESGDSLCKSLKQERETLCKDLLLSKPSCAPDEDVVLSIPLSLNMLI